jgi:hypothetical protein
MPEPTHVYAAIAAVSKELAEIGISKDRRNEHQGFKFRGVEDVLNTLAPLLPKHGLCIIPRVLSYSCTEGRTEKGKPNFHVFVDVEFDIVAVSDGSTHTARMLGEAMDQQDKAANKAMSAAYKYMAFEVFCIPTEGVLDDADPHTPEPAARETATTARNTTTASKADGLATDDQVTSLSEWLLVEGLPDQHATRIQELLALHKQKKLTAERAQKAMDALKKLFAQVA